MPYKHLPSIWIHQLNKKLLAFHHMEKGASFCFESNLEAANLDLYSEADLLFSIQCKSNQVLTTTYRTAVMDKEGWLLLQTANEESAKKWEMGSTLALC